MSAFRYELVEITCQGRDDLGQICGRQIRVGAYAASDRRYSLIETARVAGWRIGQTPDGEPDAMCPRCARPDPETVRLCRDLTASIGGAG